MTPSSNDEWAEYEYDFKDEPDKIKKKLYHKVRIENGIYIMEE
jgi:hypothetical protein